MYKSIVATLNAHLSSGCVAMVLTVQQQISKKSSTSKITSCVPNVSQGCVSSACSTVAIWWQTNGKETMDLVKLYIFQLFVKQRGSSTYKWSASRNSSSSKKSVWRLPITNEGRTTTIFCVHCSSIGSLKICSKAFVSGGTNHRNRSISIDLVYEVCQIWRPPIGSVK